jgi:hypothetical protein
MDGDGTSLSAVIDATGLSTISIGHLASLAGSMEVTVAPGTPLFLGQTFDVLTASGGITGSLTLTGPDAASFELLQNGNTLQLVHVPEPTAAAGFATMILFSTSRRRPHRLDRARARV